MLTACDAVKGSEIDTQKKEADDITTQQADKDDAAVAKQEPSSVQSSSTAFSSTELSSATISSFTSDEVVIADTTIRETLSPSSPAADSHTAEIQTFALSSEGQQHVKSIWSGLEWSVHCVVLFFCCLVSIYCVCK